MSALADISGDDVTAAGLEDLVRVAAMVQGEIDLRSGTPIETAVRGNLIRQFDADWPEGWCWEEDRPLWYEPDGYPERHDPESQAVPIDDERLYDLSWVELVHDDGRKRTLWKLFKAWYDSAERTLLPLPFTREDE